MAIDANDAKRGGPNSGRLQIGRRRAPTAAEAQATSTLFQPSAVLKLAGAADSLDGLGDDERRVAALIDGFRPLARVRTKSGLSSPAFRAALSALVKLNVLQVEALIESEAMELTGLREEIAVDGTGDHVVPPPTADHYNEDGYTMPRGAGDAIPAHVMAEIDAMLEDEMRLQNDSDGFDDELTDVDAPAFPKKDR